MTPVLIGCLTHNGVAIHLHRRDAVLPVQQPVAGAGGREQRGRFGPQVPPLPAHPYTHHISAQGQARGGAAQADCAGVRAFDR